MRRPPPATRQRSPDRPRRDLIRNEAAAALVSVLLAGLGLLAAAHPRPSGMSGFVDLPWWVLAGLFAVSLSCPVRLRGRAGSVAIEIPLTGVTLAVGLFLAAPLHLLAARLLATVLVTTAYRRRDVVRAALDTGVAVAGTGVSAALFAVTLGVTPLGSASGAVLLNAPDGATARGAIAAALAVTVAVLVGGLVEAALGAVLPCEPGVSTGVSTSISTGVSTSISTGGSTGAEAFARQLSTAAVIAVGCAWAGLVSVLASADGRAALTLGVTGSAALIVHQVFASLAARQASLERLYDLSDALAATSGWSDVIGLVLGRSLSLLHADYAELTLAAVPGGPLQRWTMVAGQSPDGQSPDGQSPDGQNPGARSPGGRSPNGQTRTPVAAPVPAGGRELFGLIRPVRAMDREFLAVRGLRGALVVPLRVATGSAGHLLVGDRRERRRGFGLDEARLLETVANHAGVALRNGQLIDRLHHEARHDELTGLPNRLSFRELLDTAAQDAASGAVPCATMLIDFDGFKSINDTLGHQAGDDLLRVLSERLAVAASGLATVARLGGDEFAVLTTSAVTPSAAAALAGRLLAVFDEPVAVAGSRLRITGSLGIALGPQHGLSGSDLMRNADIAMYAAKGATGGMRLFSDDLVEPAMTLTLATDLRDAIDHDEIEIAVQPIVELTSGRLHSVEVLARWRHPVFGEIAPEALFSAAERSGQVLALSERILDRGLALCRDWQQDGRRIRVAVNLAARWLVEPSLPEHVDQALRRYGVPPGMLCLELTERGVIADLRRVGPTLDRLRAMGVHLAVDDFGTGYSSLSYLSRLPVDQLKIDKDFVLGMLTSDRDLAIVRSIVDLGRNLGLEVVAEGVTERAAQQALVGMGCALAQGYLFARPLEPAALPAYLDGLPRELPAPRNPLPSDHPPAGRPLRRN